MTTTPLAEIFVGRKNVNEKIMYRISLQFELTEKKKIKDYEIKITNGNKVLNEDTGVKEYVYIDKSDVEPGWLVETIDEYETYIKIYNLVIIKNGKAFGEFNNSIAKTIFTQILRKNYNDAVDADDDWISYNLPMNTNSDSFTECEPIGTKYYCNPSNDNVIVTIDKNNFVILSTNDFNMLFKTISTETPSPT